MDAPGWKRPGPVPRHFLPSLEESIPLSADKLHGVGVPLGDGRAVVCAVAIDELAHTGRHATSLTPQEVPDAVRAACGAELSPSSFELLVGPFEPAEQRSLRNRSVLRMAAAVLVFCGLLSVGFERRAAHWRAVEASAQAAARNIRATLDLPQANPGTADVEIVSASVESLKAVRRAAAESKPSPDAALALAELFRGWPATDASDTQSIGISGGVVTVSTAVRGDPRRFLDALRVPEGWTLDEPRLNSAGELTRMTITMRYSQGGGR
jgi:hypothetical protein